MPYAYNIFQDLPKCQVAVATSLSGEPSGLHTTFNVKFWHVKGRALVDTGATHSFIHMRMIDTLGGCVVGQARTIRLADGNSMTSAGTAKLRITLAHNFHEFRNFIVCEQMLQGIDIILGQDFLTKNNAVITYHHPHASCTLKHNGRTIHMGQGSGTDISPALEPVGRNTYQFKFARRPGLYAKRVMDILPVPSNDVQVQVHTAVDMTPWRKMCAAASNLGEAQCPEATGIRPRQTWISQISSIQVTKVSTRTLHLL